MGEELGGDVGRGECSGRGDQPAVPLARVNLHRGGPRFDPRPTLSQRVLRLLVCWKSGLSVYRTSSENRNDAGPV